MHDAVIGAIKEGKQKVPLVEVTDFDWTAVCRLQAYQAYPAPKGDNDSIDNEAYASIFGENIELLGPLNDGGYDAVYFATPSGAHELTQRWQRFGHDFQSRLQGQYYKEKLGEKGYKVSLYI